MICRTVLVFLTVQTFAYADIVLFDGTVFPETVNWERVGTLDADRWIEDGWFHHFTDLGAWAPPPIGETDFYLMSLADFAGAETFFIEWVVETDVPSSLFDCFCTATVLVAGGKSAAFYHVMHTDERVRLLRDLDLPFIFTDHEPGEPHTFRLELCGEQSYSWFVDGELMDSGVPEGPYPLADSRIIWGSRYNTVDNHSRWDYIKFGLLTPLEDVNTDGEIDQADLTCMRNRLSGLSSCPNAEVDISPCEGDGELNLRDLLGLLDALGGNPACEAPCP